MELEIKCLICGGQAIPEIHHSDSKKRQQMFKSWKNNCSKSLSEILLGSELDPLFHYLDIGSYCSNCNQIIREINFTWNILQRLQKKISVLSNCIRKRLFSNYQSIQEKSEEVDVKKRVTALKNESQRLRNYSYNQTVEMIYAVALRFSGDEYNKWTGDVENETYNNSADYCQIKVEPMTEETDTDYAFENSEPLETETEVNTSSEQRRSTRKRKDLGIKFEESYFPEYSEIGKVDKSRTKTKRKSRALHLENSDRRKKKRKYDPKRLKCTYEECPLTFKNDENMQVHIRQIHLGEEKPYECNKCFRKFRRGNALKNHMKNLHSGARAYDHICKFCGKGYVEEDELTGHYSVAHQGPNPFSCAFCDKVCSNTTDLRKHVIEVHPDHKRPQCHECGKFFANENSLTIHGLSHKDPNLQHKCSLCNRIFSHPARLKRHMETHSKDKNFTCDICGKSFHHKMALLSHSEFHFKGKRFKCTVCDKAFVKAPSLKRHEVTHSGVKDYVCQTCGKAFNAKHNLNEHERIHLREKDPTIVVRRRINQKVISQQDSLDKPEECNNLTNQNSTELNAAQVNGGTKPEQSEVYLISNELKIQ